MKNDADRYLSDACEDIEKNDLMFSIEWGLMDISMVLCPNLHGMLWQFKHQRGFKKCF